MKAKLKYQEEEGVAESNRFCEIQHECKVLQSRIESLEAAKDMLEVNLKDETSARSQLVSQVFNLRKVLCSSFIKSQYFFSSRALTKNTLDSHSFPLYYNATLRLYFNDLTHIEYCEKKFSYHRNGNAGE